MGWRSVVISHPAHLSLAQQSLQVEQHGQQARVPLEDVSILVIDHPQITLTAALLSACADAQIAVICVGANHHPNGVLLPYLPHSRALKVMRTQLAMPQPLRKRLWQTLIQAKIRNQAAVLRQQDGPGAQRLAVLAGSVRSGDPDNLEAQAAQVYFHGVFGAGFVRGEACFYNAALNYGYAILRAALARNLVAYGFLPAFGLFHCNEQNAFNLADDLIEPWRAVVDAHVLRCFPLEPSGHLAPSDKAALVALLHRDIVLNSHAPQGACTVLAGLEASVVSLVQIVMNQQPVSGFVLPQLDEGGASE